jgi:predicted CXXCH cytochrome family protein
MPIHWHVTFTCEPRSKMPKNRPVAFSRANVTWPRPRLLLIPTLALFLTATGAVVLDWWTTIPADHPPRFVGRQTCANCHPKEAAAYRDSHHDLAMDVANQNTVLGDFSGVNFSHHGIDSRLFREGERYFIRTEGPDGVLSDFEVKYVFGVTPLQQYMVEFDRPLDAKPNEIARLQVLRISWDTVKKEWFYLPPPDVPGRILPGDDLHWTGAAQRWNSMCADCHSTNFRKGFDVKSAQYKSTYSEIDVSCESCHGAGGNHVELASAASFFWDRKQGKAIGGFKKAEPETELGACFRCHSRRQLLTEEWRPGQSLSEVAMPESLSPLTHHCDGQILDEVYEHGSFLQSRMHAKGIRCTDCHDPHSAKLKHQGNNLCTSCHQHPAGKYDSPAHHKHQPQGAGASCVDCHMPSKTYMEVDVRRDHSFRVPRPDQSLEFGTPNACTSCHVDTRPFVADDKLKRAVDVTSQSSHLLPKPTDYHKLIEIRKSHPDIDQELKRLDAWAAKQVEIWYGPKRQHGAEYAKLLYDHWNGHHDPSSKVGSNALKSVAEKRTLPAIVRASALTELSRGGLAEISSITKALKDDSPLVRAAACSAAESHFPTAVQFLEARIPRQEWLAPQFTSSIRDLARTVAQRLNDPVLSVRNEAARALARLPSPLRQDLLSGDQHAGWQQSIEAWQASLVLQGDRSGAHTALGVFHESQERWNEAIASYETAIRIEPNTVGPRSNLSTLLERISDDLAAPSTERQFELHGEIGAEALRTRSNELIQAEAELLKRDADLVPQLAPLRYQYALALVRLKKYTEAESELRRAVEIDPAATQFLYTLVILLKERADSSSKWREAAELAAKLIALAPEDPRFAQLGAEIDAARGGMP